MPTHSYSPYWLSCITKQQYVVILCVLMMNVSLFLHRSLSSNVMYVLFACLSQIESCMQLLQNAQ